MKTEYPGLFRKYLNGDISKKQAKRLFGWLKTAEGKKYAGDYFSKDVKDGKIPLHLPANPDKLWQKVQRDVFPRKQFYARHLKNTWIAAAAIVILAVIGVVFYLYPNTFSTENIPIEHPFAEYSAGAEEKKILTLSDGTVIHLNENSSVSISGDFPQTRTVALKGDAFFDVIPGNEQPFIIHSEDLEITVLGTRLLVKNNSVSREFIVAVSEGKVMLSNPVDKSEEYLIEKDKVGIYQFSAQKAEVYTENVDNYFRWFTGRIVFEEMPFPDVLVQLSRMFDIENEVLAPELNNRILTADLTETSPEEVLQTIAVSLDAQVQLQGHKAVWASAVE